MAIEFDCPYCTTSIRVPDSANGKKGKCPRCEKIVRVPTIEIPAAPSPPKEPARTEPPVEPTPPAPKEPSPGTPDGAPPRPSWLGGSAEPPPEDHGGFVEATPDGPPDFSALTGDDDETRQLERSEVESSVPVTDDGIGAIPAFGEQGGGVVQPGERPAGPRTGKRVVRRRKRKKSMPPWLIPVACVAVMGGLLGWWMLRSQPKLTGELKAEAFGFYRPPPKLVDATSAGVDSAEMAAVAKALGEISSIKSDFMRIDLRGQRGAIEVRAVETRKTRFVRLLKTSNPDLVRYLKDMPDALDEVRLRQMKSAARALVAKVTADGVAVDSTNNRLVRDDLALAVLTGPLGFNLVARYDKREFPCCYEDADGAYFLMPLEAGRFRVEGREIDGRVVFAGEYVVQDVKELGGERPAGYEDPWLAKPEGGPDPGPRDEAPPLSAGAGGGAMDATP